MKQLYQSAARADLLLDFVWKPCTDADLVYADELSRLIDSSDIFLSQFVFDNICNLQLRAGQSWGVPRLDCFAGHAKGQYQVSRFYSKFYGPDALAVNAMYQDWAVDAALPSNNNNNNNFYAFQLMMS